MPERDILLERLEKKLSQKEKEVEELKMMMSFGEQKIAEIKKELLDELRTELGNRKIRELEAKVVELSKTVESLTNDVLYLKEEISKGKITEKVEVQPIVVKEKEDDIIRADPCLEPDEKEEAKGEFIVCD
jgi:predicted RNase H-like nuclease (RuvC/YqgF family)